MLAYFCEETMHSGDIKSNDQDNTSLLSGPFQYLCSGPPHRKKRGIPEGPCVHRSHMCTLCLRRVSQDAESARTHDTTRDEPNRYGVVQGRAGCVRLPFEARALCDSSLDYISSYGDPQCGRDPEPFLTIAIFGHVLLATSWYVSPP